MVSSTAGPAGSANFIGGKVSHTGFHFLPGSCGFSESVRLFTGEIYRNFAVASISSVIEGFGFEISQSADNTVFGPLGHGWRHTYGGYIDAGVSLVTLYSGTGARYDYIPDGSGGWMVDTSTTSFQTHELTNPTGTIWELKEVPKGLIYRFDATALSGYPATAGRLTEIEDRHGNILTLHYTSGKLTSIEEPQGREILLGYTGDLITSVTDPRSLTTLLSYDNYGNLASVAGPEGCATTFEYAQAEDHRVTAITDARGQTTRYEYQAERIAQIYFPDGQLMSYRYQLGDEAPEEWLGDTTKEHLDTTLVTLPDLTVHEYRFDGRGNLWRSISPSGHTKRYFWNSNQRLLYCSEGYQLQMLDTHGPADNINNKHTRFTVDARGDTVLAMDATGVGTTFEYDSEGRVLVKHPGQVNVGIQGAWEGHYGADGIVLCAFNSDATDRYLPPGYLSSTLATAITNGDGSGGDTFTGAHFASSVFIDPRAPVAGDGSIKPAVGHWTQSGSAAPGATFQFAVNLNQSKAFNLSLYSHSADHGLSEFGPLKYNEQYGRDIQLEVTDIHGTQIYRVPSNAAGVWATFPVEGDVSNPIQVTVRAAGASNKPVISAVAFDPLHDRRTFFEYTSGNLTKITDGLGNETNYAYNADGTLQAVTDARGKTTTYAYLDADKNLTKVTDEDSNETLFEYDQNGNVTKITDANLKETTMVYDGKNRVTLVTDALLNETAVEYDGNGNVITVTDAKDRVTTFGYNNLNQLTTIENELGHVVRMAYDVNGRLAAQTNPLGFVTRYSYNSDGNLARVDTPDVQSTTMSYDELNRLVALTGPNGNQETMELVNLVGAGNLFRNPGFENVDRIEPPGPANWVQSSGGDVRDSNEANSGDYSVPLSLSEYSWSQNKLHLPKGAKFAARAHAKRDRYDLVLRATTRDFSAAAVSQETSEAFGDKFNDWAVSEPLLFNVPGDAQVTPSNPTLVSFTAQVTIANDKIGWLDDMELFMLSTATRYNNEGQLKSVTTPDGATVTLYRDHLGRVIASEDPRGFRTEMSYDALDRVISLSKPSGETLEFAYNEVSALVSFKDGLDQEIVFAYDDLNRLETITYPDTTTEDFSYDGVGNLLSYTDNAGQVRSFAYDDLNRLETITYPDTSTVQMTYDEVGNLKTLTERNGDLLEYDYDDLDRLVKVTRTKDGANTTPEWELDYEYDANGNLLRVSDTGGELWSLAAPSALYGTAKYGEGRYNGALDAMDRPRGIAKGATVHATFRYDIEGRRTGVDFDNGARTDVAFDIVGRPLSLATSNENGSLLSTTYLYDQASNRIGQVSGTDTFDYAIDDDGKLVGESINRLVIDGAASFAKGSLEALRLDDTLTLLPLDDDFSGEELDCDRWRVIHHAKFTSEAAEMLGMETRQNQGLRLSFPRGYTERTKFRDNVQPLDDDLGHAAFTSSNAVEHRVQLLGDFDIRVDLTDFIGATLYPTYEPATGLRLSAQKFEDGGSPTVRFDFNTNNEVVMTGTGGTSAMAALSLPVRFRLVRSGTTLTGYVYDFAGSTWVTQAGWTRTFGSMPAWISVGSEYLLTNASAATFENFLYAGASPGSRVASGNYVSQTYDAGRNVAWQNISWAETLPGGTDVEIQVAFSDNAEGPWTFIGPDGTSGTRFTTSGGQSVGASMISRYAKVKAYLTGNGTATPALGDIHLSYSGSITSQRREFTYDLAGNLLETTLQTDSGILAETRTYDGLNQIVDNEIDDGTTVATWTYTHDTNGNLTSKTNGTDTYDYSWDEDNRLVGVELNSTPVVLYEYDSASRLIQRVEGGTTTNYTWDGWDLVREEKTGAVTETTNYLVPMGEVLAFERGGDWYYMHGDALSTTQLVTDENGDQVGRFIHGAWGQELYASESVTGVLENRFVGGLGCRKDAATGLIYMRHRWYDCELQRFISRDPIGLDGGTNLYCYSESRPVTFVDPLGLRTPGAGTGTGRSLPTRPSSTGSGPAGVTPGIFQVPIFVQPPAPPPRPNPVRPPTPIGNPNHPGYGPPGGYRNPGLGGPNAQIGPRPNPQIGPRTRPQPTGSWTAPDGKTFTDPVEYMKYLDSLKEKDHCDDLYDRAIECNPNPATLQKILKMLADCKKNPGAYAGKTSFL